MQRFSAKKNQLMPLVLGLLVVVAGLWLFLGNNQSTDNAYIKADLTILAPKVSGYVTEVAFADNAAVQKGAVLFRINDQEYIARLHEAEAQVSLQKARRESLLSQRQLQAALIQQAEAAIASANANLAKSNKELLRAQKLIKQGAVSQQYLDSAAAEQENATAMLTRSKAALDATKRQADMYDSGLLELDASLKGAEAALELAQIDLANTIITAPQDGHVGNRSIQIGQLARPGAVLAYLIPEEIWVEANFKESQISAMQAGQKVHISVDGYSAHKFTGTVTSSAPATGSEFSLLPPENATGNFTKITRRVPVRIDFDSTPELKHLRPGMSTEVTVIIK